MRQRSPCWDKLFVGDVSTLVRRDAFYILRKEGHDLLALPTASRRFKSPASLYQPQTVKARWALRTFLLATRSPLAFLLPARSVDIHRTAFADFLKSGDRPGVPLFAVLHGNPAESGRRFIFGLLDDHGAVQSIIKCGIDAPARELVRGEIDVLQKLGARFPAIPPILRERITDEFCAFAQPYFPTLAVPLPLDERVELARSWIHSRAECDLGDLPAWRSLDSAVPGSHDVRVKPVVYHGDFTPWNMRDDHGRCILVDWEKAELEGPPLWDLLHYELNTEILVHRSKPRQVLRNLKALLQSQAVLNYLKSCQSLEHRDVLVDGYLRHLDANYPQIRGRDTVNAIITAWQSSTR